MATLTEAGALALFRDEPAHLVETPAGAVAHRAVGTGPDVLLVHGWPVSGATFRRLLPHLVDHVTCHVIDLPGAGSSPVDRVRGHSFDQHIVAVREVVDQLGLARFAAVGHDSGGLVVRHAFAGDARVVAMGLIDTEPPPPLSWRFRLFLANRHVPGFGAVLGALAARPRLRRNGFVFGDAFVDRSLLDGDFDELFLRPLARDSERRWAAMAVLRSFHPRYVAALSRLHEQIGVPVQLVWGEHDAFFPVQRAREMAASLADGRLAVVPGAGLFAHEERPAEVADALLRVLRSG
jgi:pimeloyl-ACP methyl ester carboxylesterase